MTITKDYPVSERLSYASIPRIYYSIHVPCSIESVPFE